MTKANMNEAEKEKITHALNLPHGLSVIDKVLKIKTDGFQTQVTLGWETPSGNINPACTLVMSDEFAHQLGGQLQAATKPSKKT